MRLIALSLMLGLSSAQASGLSSDLASDLASGLDSGLRAELGDRKDLESQNVEIGFEPSVWYASPGGNLKLGVSPTIPTRKVNVDSPRLSPAGRVSLRVGEARFSLDATNIRVAGTSNEIGETIRSDFVFTPLQTIRTEFELTMIEPRVRLPIREFESSGEGIPVRARLDFVGGIRFSDLRVEIEVAGGGTGRDEGNLFSVQPIAGLGVSLEVYEFVEMDVAATVGAMPEIQGVTSTSADVKASFRFRLMDNEFGRLSALGGYRIMITSLLDPDEVEFDGAIAGLFFGAEWRF